MRSLKRLCCALLCALALVLCLHFARRASAANFNVNSLADTPDASLNDGVCADAGGACTLRAAIQQANADPPGDVIGFSVNGTINLTGALPDISNSMTINGPGSDKLTVRRDTGGVYRILTIKSGAMVMLSGFTISNGVAPAGPATPVCTGGGLFNSGALTTNDFNVSGNSTAGAPAGSATPVCPGGGIYNEGALAMTFSAVFGNSTGKGGTTAAARNGGNGGGIANAGTLSMTHCAVFGNSTGKGGDADPDGGKGGDGGGIYNFNDGVHTSVATLTACGVDGNGTGGGGVFQGTGGNSGSGSGGNGGGIANFTTMTITGSHVDDNGTGSGADAQPTVKGTAGSGGDGGGIYNAGTLKAVNCVLDGNGTGGGGVGNNLTCGFGNGGNGGGIASPTGSTLKLSQSTVVNSHAGFFGGVCGTNGTGGGIYGSAGVQIRSTLVARNSVGFPHSGMDVSGDSSFDSLGYNYIGANNSSCCSTSTDHGGVPSAPDLGLNLDPVTLIPFPGSFLIDAGLALDADGQPVTTDIRGDARPTDDPAVPPQPGGDNSDVGAFERQSTDPTPTPTPAPTPTPTLPFVQFGSATSQVGEGCVQTQVTVTRTGPLDGATVVTYETVVVSDVSAGGFATQRGDFTYAVGSVVFGPGEDTKSVPLLISEDAYAEGTEEVLVFLGSATGGKIGAPNPVHVQIVDNDISDGATNPIDGDDTFVCQHYHDFLSRQADDGGQSFWSSQLAACGADAQCRAARRVGVSAAFFLSIEFQQTGYYVIRTNKVAFGDQPGTPRYLAFLAATQEIGRGVVVGQGDWQTQLENNKQRYAEEISTRGDFSVAHAGQGGAGYVNSLFANAGVTPTQAERDAAIAALGDGGDAGRARALRSVVESGSVYNKLYNEGFVLSQYFGYLRRNPDNAPDTDFSGYNFWLSKLNQFTQPGEDVRDDSVALARVTRAEMVRAFLLSAEYRGRFQGDPDRGSQIGSVASLGVGVGWPQSGLRAALFGDGARARGPRRRT
jgi:CSLREA domain-containing protein